MAGITGLTSLVPTRRIAFDQWLKSAYPGTIIWDGQAPDDSTVQPAYNRGVTGLPDSATFPGPELLVDGNMEAVGVGDWTSNNSATLTKETTNPYAGTQLLRVAYNGTGSPGAVQTILTSGVRNVVTGWARSDGTRVPQVLLQGGGVIWTGTTSTDWQYIYAEGVSTGTAITLRHASAAGYVEFDNMSTRTANPLNADATGATPAQPFSPPQIPYAWSFINNDKLTVLDSTLATGFDLAKYEILIFAKMRIPTATVETLFRVTAGTDLCEIRNSASGELTWRFKVGAVDEEIVVGSLATDVPFMASILCEDGDNGDFVTAKFNGVQVGTSTSVGFGTVATITDFTIGAAVSAQYLDGLVSVVMLKPNGQLSDSEELAIYQRSSI